MDQNIFNRIALYFGLQYKPSLGAEWKKKKSEMKNVTIKI